ncbi:CARDB domain-containing protein [Phycicoccus avicenniae]|uniref:CARDB domain-containing protein n=1 Tax=Phycicoccus avicenniae TaxID=2828860 RepID=UPI003D27B5D8
MLLLTVGGSLAFPADSQVALAATVRSFGKLFSQQTNGSIVITGNRVLTCPASTACTDALAGTTASSNNNFTMTQLDLDGIAGTADSSSANVAIPSGARVLYAGLFWGAARTAGTGGSAAAGTANQIKLRAPGEAAYTTLTADTIDSSGLATNDYSAYKNVTSIVQGAGAGTYWGADISAATGADRYGAWSLVVAIGDPTAPLRDLSVFNGYATLTNTETVTTNISGFLTPATGTVNAKFGTVVYEGDAGISGDYMTVGSTRLADAESPSANFFGSRITAGGANLGNRNPASVNNLGVDAKVVDAPGVVANGSTSTNVTFSTAGDFYYPAVLTTQIDLFAPTISGSKSVTNLNGNSPAKVGDTLEYTVAFTNSGDDNATNAVVEDALPANTTFVPGSLTIAAGANVGSKTDGAGDDQAEYVSASRLVRYRVGTGANATTGGTLAKGGTSGVRFRVTVDTAAAGTTVTNSANLLYTAATLGTRYTYQTADVSTPVAALADLSLTKSASPSSVNAGNTITYALRAANAGPTAAGDVVVTDTLPTGTTLVSNTPSQGSCSAAGQVLTCALGTVANGADATVAVVVRVPAGTSATGVTNVAEVTSSTSDPSTTNNRATVTTLVTRSADVAITKEASTATPVPGSRVTYTVTATNNGPSAATGVVVTDSLPTAFSGLSATTTAGTCTVTGNGVSCAVGALDPGAGATVRITATLDSAIIAGALTNRAQVQSDTPDSTPGNNTAAVTVTPGTASADVQVSKSTVTSPVVAGAPVQYRIAVTNVGPSVARDVTVTDAGPAALALVTATSSLGSCTVTGTTVTCTIDPLASGATATITVNATVRSTTTGTLTNSASATSTTVDPNPGNNSGTTSDAVTTRADLDVSKTAAPNPVINGQNVTYTMTVRNIGPSVSRSVVLSDPVPAPLGYVSSSSTQGTCSQAGGTVTCAIGDLALGAAATITVVAAVPGGGGAEGVVNTATVTSPTTDPVSGNNSASYALTTGASANIVLSKTAAPQPVTAGAQITFTLTARNDGPSTASVVTITDPLPSSVAPVSATTTTPGASCSIAGQDVTCTAPTLASGSSLVATVVGTVASGTPASTLVNTATAGAQTPGDPTLSDNTATSTTRVQTRADLSIDKTGPATVTAGTGITWTMTVRNDGPSVADTVVVQDTLPAGVTFVSGTGTGTTCDEQAGGGGVLCDVGTLASGATRTITLVGRVDADVASGATLTNSATVSSATTDPTPGNNTDTHTTTVATSADVSLTKTAAPDPLTAGAPATYSVVATNGGPSTAQGLTVTDTVPAGLTIRSATFAGGTCAVAGQVVTCTRPSLASGASAEVLVQVTVGADLTGSVTNTASVGTTSTDPTPGNNTAQVASPVERAADLQVIKTADQQSVVAGSGLTYTITVVNNGPSTATGAAVTDTLPAGLTYISSTTSAGSCSTSGQLFSCALGDVAPGTAVTIAVSARVGAGAAPGTITNTAGAASTTTDPTSGNNSASIAVDVVASADLSMTKTASSETLVPGTPLSYSVTVTNSGPSTARTVTVTDAVPNGVEGVTASWGPSATPCAVTGQDVACDIGTLPVGQVTVTITGTLASQFSGASISNTARVTSTTDDPDADDTTATATSRVVGQADLALIKTMAPANPVAGQQVVFTLTATNNGPSAALNPQFIDQLPAGLTDVSVVPPPGATGCDVIPPVDPGRADNPNAPTVVCSGPIFRAGFTVSGTITATVSPGFTGVLSNTGRTSSDTIDPVASNNESTVSGTVRQSADLSITKTMSPTVPVPGQPVTYTLTVRNAGPSSATGVTVADSPPAALTGVTATSTVGSCTVATGNAASCALGTLAPSATATVTVTGTLRPDFTGTLSNTASVSSSTADPDTTNNSATATGTAAPSADVSIVKTMSPINLVPGQPISFTLAVRNNGPSTATAVSVTDDLDRAIGGASATTTAGTCAVNGSNALSCQLGALAPNGTATVLVTGTLAPSFTGTLSNTATVSSSTLDPTPANNTSSVSGGSGPSADVAVTKTMSPAAPIPGSAVGYTVVVRNNGPSTAGGLVVTDQLNAAISAVTATADNGSTCSVNASNLMTCSLGGLAPGATVTVSITGTLAAGFTGTLSNTASASSVTADPDTTNNSATVSGTARPSADVSVTKSMSPTIPVPGRQVTFTLAVANAGPSTATGVTLADQLNPALTGATASTTAGTCTVGTDNALACSIGSLTPGGTATVTVRATLSPMFTGTLSNTTTVASPTPDPVPANNTSTVTGDGAPSADLAITKTMSPNAPVPGQRVTFTLTVTNAGPSAATGVTVADQLNTALTAVATTTTAGTCTVSTGNALSCAVGTVLPGGSVTVTASGTLGPAYTGPLSNTSTVSSPTGDPNTVNNSATVTGQTAPTVDLVVGKTMSPTNPVPGQQVSFTVTVRNEGPSTAQGVTVSDALNGAITGATATSATGTCTVGTDNVVGCSLGALAPNATATVTITGTLAPGFTGTLANTASTSTTTTEPDTSDNSATVSGVAAPSADVSIAKSMSPTAPIPGSAISYSLVVTNDGPSSASSVVVADRLSSAISAVTATVDNGTSCTLGAGDQLTCPVGTLAPGATVTVSVTGTLAADFTGTLSNTATVSSPTPDPDPADNTSTVTGTSAPSADLVTTKSLSPTAPVPGQPVTYTVQVRNAGPSTAVGVTLSDQLGASLTGATARTTAGTCTISGTNAVACALGSLAPGATATVTITANLAPDFTSTLSNTATASSDTPDPSTANNTATASGTAAPSADVAVTKTVSPTRPVPGQQVTFTLTVRNTGPSEAAAVTLSDQVAAALTGVTARTTAGTCTVGTDNLIGCSVGAVAPGGTVTVTVVGTLDPAFTGTLSNTATVASPTPDPDTNNNSATASGDAAPSADVSITKTMAPVTPVAGEPVTFTLTVRNAGPSTATGVRVTDELDPALSGAVATSTTGSCAVDGATLACDLGTLPPTPGTPVVITVTADLDPDFTGTLENTGSVTATTPDPVPANNSATATAGSSATADLTLTKAMSPTAPIPGSAVTFTLTARNEGPSTAVGVVVTDRLDPAIGAVTATADDGTVCTVDGGELSCPVGTLEPATEVTVTVTGTLATGFTGQLTNTGTVGATTPDSDPSNNSDTVQGVAAPSADVTVAKSLAPTSPVPGQPVTYTITVDNTGPSAAAAVTVTDQVSPALTGVTATTTAGSCAVSDGNALTCADGTVEPEATVTVTVRGTLSPDFTGPLSNTAAATSSTPDPDTSNNRATVDGDATPSADLSITKRMTPAAPVPGETVTYTLDVRNDGASSAASVMVADRLDEALVGVVARTSVGSCTVGSGNVLSCSLGTLAPDADASVTVTATLDPAFTGTLSNTATVSSPTPDPNATDNTDTVSGDAAPSADLSVRKTMSPAAPVPGQEVTFTLTARNDGPSTAVDVKLEDQLAASLADPTVTTTVGTCAVDADDLLACDLGDLAPGAVVVVTVTAVLDADATGTLSNTATVSSPTDDPDPTDDSATVSGTTAPSADLAVDKTISPAAPIPGSAVTFTITVDNLGPSTATDVVLTDPLDGALGDVTATADDGSTCTVDGDGVLTCELGDLAPSDDVVTVTVTATLAPDFTGTLSNTASVSSATDDPDPTNDVDTVTGDAAPSADVAVDKAVSPTAPVPGERVTFTLTVTSTGPSTAEDVTLSDPLDAVVSDVDVSTTEGTCEVNGGVLECDLGDLQPDGQPVVVTVSALVAADATGTLANTATIHSTTPDPVSDNDSDTVTAELEPSADLSLTKTISPTDPVPGGEVTYTITIENAGPSAATGVTVTDTLPEGLSGIDAATLDGTCAPVDDDRVLTCDLGSLPVGDEATVVVTAILDAEFTGTLFNTATVSSATDDPDPSNDSDTVTGDAAPAADLSVVKEADGATAVAGGEVGYTITLRNNGPSTATDVTLSDPLPDVLADATATTDVGTCAAIGTDGLLECDLGDLAPGAVVTVTVSATVAADATSDLTNTATVDSPTADPDTDDRESSAVVRVVADTDLSITKDASTDDAEVGDVVTYTITVANSGPSSAAGVVVTDRLPNGLTLAGEPRTDTGSCASAAQVVTCRLGTLGPEQRAVIVLRVRVGPGEVGRDLKNVATVTSATGDQVSSNNEDEATVVVSASAPPPSGGPSAPPLARTGAMMTLQAQLGLVLLGIGTVLVLGSRRRRQDR